MSMPLSKPPTLEEFLAWERKQELRYEFDGFHAVAMTGGTVNHAVITDNAVDALRRRLKSPCRAFTSNLKVLAAGKVRYPDVVVTCSPIDGSADTVPNPVVVFEVLSPSTASLDRVVKNEEYRATPSIQRYVMLEQTRIGATVFARAGESWIGTVMLGDATLELPEIGVAVALVEFYRDVDLPPPDTDD
ncbi:MAG TPA: Uma2 family endonuclease [Acetobacteraceae bacterium]|nr:Uma2 family endonuclease [Acetobacteraceae bacterium]